tara:strand:- start:1236 stop:2867 length:1632 start_codon:yes stop_codon:yes gene_type:complete
MCGIVGACMVGRDWRQNVPIARQIVERAFNVSNARGPEHSALKEYNDGACFLGMHRLAINGLENSSNQPIEYENLATVCNGEIYNHATLIRGWGDRQWTNSDCESILHVLRNTNPKIGLSTLDGVFALCMHDNQDKSFLVARDTFGVRPLFWGVVMIAPECQLIVFSSELKHLTQCDPGSVMQFRPGTFTKYEFIEDRGYQLYDSDTFRSLPPCCMTDTAPALALTQATVRNALEDAVWKRVQNTERELAVALSGGLDSTIIAAIAARCIAPRRLRTFSIGLEGSPDLAYAAIAAKHINAEHTEILCTESDFVNAVPEVIRAIESYDTTTVRASVGNYLLAKYISKNTDCKVVLNGDGADEVAGGYIYFRAAPSSSEFDAECRRLLTNIHYFDVLRSDRCMAAFGLEARTAFLDPAFVSAYFMIPVEERMPRHGTIEKALLRSAFQDIIPAEIVSRKKEAFSDGVSSYRRSWYTIINENLNAIGAIETGCSLLQYNTPTTREMGIYRSIFREAYPGCDHVIPYFWMPRWVNARDSSARTLEIY